LTPPARPCLKSVHKITSFLDCPEFIATHRQNECDFIRKRHLTFRTLILFLLNQPGSALQTELDQFFRVLNSGPFENAQAFSKARRKLKPAASLSPPLWWR
jgi:hypothetical protein